MEIAGRLLGNTMWLFLAQAVGRAAGFAYALTLARFLGVEGFGEYSLIFAVVGLFAVVAEGGVTTLMMRDVARDKGLAPHYMGMGLILSVVLGLVAYIALVTTVVLLGYPLEVTHLILLAGLSLILNNVSSVFISIFNAFERMKVPALLSMASSIIIVMTGILLLLAGFGLEATVYAVLIASLIQLFGAGYLATRELAHPSISSLSRQGVWKFLSEALPYGLRALLGIIYFKVDMILLSKMTYFVEVGYYSASYKILEILLAVIAVVNLVLFPLTSSLHVTSKERLRFLFEKYTLYTMVLSLPGLALLLFFARQFLSFLYGVQFQSATSMLQLLLVGLALMYANAPLSNLVLSSDLQKKVLVLSVITAGSNLGLNLLFIPQFGGNGAALATIGSELVTTVVFYRLVRGYIGRTAFLVNIVKPGISVLVASLIMAVMAPFPLPFRILAFLLVYGSSLLIVRAFALEDKALIRQAFGYLMARVEGTLVG